MNINKLSSVDQAKVNESQELIYQVLEHISAGRLNGDLIKEKLIQAAKNLPSPLHSGLSKYS